MSTSPAEGYWMGHRYAACCVVLVLACSKDEPNDGLFETAAQTTVPASTIGPGGDTGDGDTGEGEEGDSSSGDPVTGPPPATETSDGDAGETSSGGVGESGTTGAPVMDTFNDCPTLDVATCPTLPHCMLTELGTCGPNPAYCQAFADQATCDAEAECLWSLVGFGCTIDCPTLEMTACMGASSVCYWSAGGDGQLPGCYPLF